MQIKNRQQTLLVATVAFVALFAANLVLINPLTHAWKARSDRITELRKQIAQGQQLQRRGQGIRSRWEQMRRNTLPNNTSAAEQQIFRAIDDWARRSRATVTAINPQWKHDADDYNTYECRLDLSGELSALSTLLYDGENDPMALKLESVELGARDKEGQQMALAIQISGLVLNPQAK